MTDGHGTAIPSGPPRAPAHRPLETEGGTWARQSRGGGGADGMRVLGMARLGFGKREPMVGSRTEAI